MVNVEVLLPSSALLGSVTLEELLYEAALLSFKPGANRSRAVCAVADGC